MPGYFEAMKIPLIAGRTFGAEDGLTGPRTIIVNQAFASKYFRMRARSASTFKWVRTTACLSIRSVRLWE